MMNEVQEPSVEDFKRLYEQADQYTRQVALIGDGAVIPAHNELRNAGCHLQRALGAKGCVENEDELRKGISHCQRALYEASESGIIVLLEKLGYFEKDYKDLNISSIIPEIRGIRGLKREARDLLLATRPNSQEASPETDKYMEMFGKLNKAMSFLEDNKSDLHAERDKLRQSKLEDKNRTIRWLITTIIGLFITLIGLIFV